MIGADGDYSQSDAGGRVFIYYGIEDADTSWDRRVGGRQAGDNAG